MAVYATTAVDTRAGLHWWDLAACKDVDQADLAKATKRAKRACASCVVAEACLWAGVVEEWGLELACRWGIRGGLSSADRRRLEDSLREAWGLDARLYAEACAEGELVQLGMPG